MAPRSGLKPITVLIPMENEALVKEAAAMDGVDKMSVYLRKLVNQDLRSKGLLPERGDIITREVEWDGSPLKKRNA